MECRTYLSKVRDILNSKTLLVTRVSEEGLCVCWQLLEEGSSHGEEGWGGEAGMVPGLLFSKTSSEHMVCPKERMLRSGAVL